MDSNLNEYFDVALKIHKICDGLKLSKDDARLFVYVYVKIKENGEDYFEKDNTTDVLALKTMLGQNPFKVGKDIEPEKKQVMEKLCSTVNGMGKMFSSMDKAMLDKHGMEYRFGGELNRRLRFHTDKKFQNEKMEIFKTQIMIRI